MYKILIFFFLCASLPLSSLTTMPTIQDSLTSIWNKLWSLSCEFTTIAPSTRVKRSIDFPNTNDSDELYDFLYPSFDLKPEDARSSSPLSWFNDAIDYWQNECQHLNQSNDDVSDSQQEMGKSANETIANATGSTFKLFGSSEPGQKNVIGDARDKRNLTKVNKWFTTYGGDIEYFYPLWGWGLPFDGEITFLGFHGFQGIFPYR